MKKKSNADLWALTRALSQPEWRYFRRYTTLHGRSEDKIYWQLFLLIRNQEAYNSQEIQEAMDDPQFTKRYSAHKNYLHALILKSMRSYNADRFMANRIQGLVADGIFLFHKALYNQSRKKFRKAEKMAVELESYVHLPEIYSWKRRLLKRMREKDRLQKLKEVAEKYVKTLDRLKEEQEWYGEYEKLYAENQRDPSSGGGAGDRTEVDFSQRREPEGFQAKHHFFQAKIFLARLKNDWKTAFEWQKKQLELWREKPPLIGEEPRRFSAVVANFLALATQMEDWEAFAEIRPVWERIRYRSELEKLQAKQQGLFFDLLFHLNQGTFAEGLKLVPIIEDWLNQHRSILHKTREMAFSYNLTMLAFLGKDRKTALTWCNELLNSGRDDVRLDIQAALHLVQFILFTENGDPDLVEGKYRSLSRFLKLHYPNSFLSWILPRLNQAFKEDTVEPATYSEWLQDMDKVVEVFKWEDQTGLNEIRSWLKQQSGA